jgi:hypothetical protein
MRISLASISKIATAASLALALTAACGAPKAKPESPLVNEGSAVPDNCCCKSSPITSADGLPIYERGTNRMECSSKQGTCVDDVQCQGKDEPPASSSSVPPPPPPP